MEPNKDSTPESNEQSSQNQQAPADALSRTPDDLEQEAVTNATPSDATKEPEVKVSKLKLFFRHVNVYFLIFVLIFLVVGIVAVVNYLNGQKEPEVATVPTQTLTDKELKNLATNDASVGDTSQTLTIKGNAIIAGQSLMRGNLNVAGNFQVGGSIRGNDLTISGESNLGSTQINSLQVAEDTTIDGSTTLQDLNVSGAASFGGAVKAPQLTVSRLILSGNASLEVPNHIGFPGQTPTRSVTSSVLGSGGTASVSGSDTAGTVNIGTGNNPSTGCFVRITFRQTFTKQPHVIVSPVGAGAGLTSYYVERDTSGFSICSATTPPKSRAFAFDYFVTN